MRWGPADRRALEVIGQRGDRLADATECPTEGFELVRQDLCESLCGGVRDLGEEHVEHLLGRGGHVDEDAPAILRVPNPLDVALSLQSVEHAGHRAGRDVHGGADLARSHRSGIALDDSQGVQLGV